MKNNNSYLTNDEINFDKLIKSLWREKILILFISIVSGLAGYLYASFKPQEFMTEIQIKNPPYQMFENYTFSKNNNIANVQFISDFKLNYLSLDNLQSFLEESKEFDNFKGYLKSRNISAKNYFEGRINEVKDKNLINSNKYILYFHKELEGDTFLNSYSQFIKKKTLLTIKKILKLSIENQITIHENALEVAKQINLEKPNLRSGYQLIQGNEYEDLFNKGSTILSLDIFFLKKLLIKLENDQFDYEFVVDKATITPVKVMPNFTYFVIGIMLGLFLSLGIIFFKDILKNH